MSVGFGTRYTKRDGYSSNAGVTLGTGLTLGYSYSRGDGDGISIGYSPPTPEGGPAKVGAGIRYSDRGGLGFNASMGVKGYDGLKAGLSYNRNSGFGVNANYGPADVLPSGLTGSLGISVSQFGGTTLTGGLVQGKGMGSYGLGFSLNDRTGLVADVRNSGGTLLSYDTSNGQFAFDSSQFAMSLAKGYVQDENAKKTAGKEPAGSKVQKGFLEGFVDSFGELGTRLWNGAKAIPSAVVNAGKWVANTASAAWDGVIYGAKTAWDGISNTSERIANFLTPDNNGDRWNWETDAQQETRQTAEMQKAMEGIAYFNDPVMNEDQGFGRFLKKIFWAGGEGTPHEAMLKGAFQDLGISPRDCPKIR